MGSGAANWSRHQRYLPTPRWAQLARSPVRYAGQMTCQDRRSAVRQRVLGLERVGQLVESWNGIGVVLAVPGVTGDPGGDGVRGPIVMLAGAGAAWKIQAPRASAAAPGSARGRSSFAACPADAG